MEGSSAIPTGTSLPTIAIGREQRGSVPINSENSVSETPYCFQCEYNLTGIKSGRCPECGWVIDWNVACANEELRRIGTPAHLAEGRRMIPAALASVGLMLFRPVTFARRLRYDEGLWLAALVAIGSCLVAAVWSLEMYGVTRSNIRWGASYATGILTCMLLNSLAMATLLRNSNPFLTWRKRLRVAVLLSLYATCFVALWPLLNPPLVNGSKTNFLFPCGKLESFPGTVSDLQLLGRSALFYWWALILFAFVCVRTNRRWAKVVCLPLIWLACCAGFWAGYFVYDRFPFNGW